MEPSSAANRLRLLIQDEPTFDRSPEANRARLEVAFQLADEGVALYLETLRRRNPAADPAQLNSLLEAWLLERPGAEEGDGVGVSCLSRFL